MVTSSNENHRLNNIDMSGSSSSSTRSCRISNRKTRDNNDTNIRSTATSSNENHRLNNIDMSGSSSSSTRSCRISNRKARVNNDTNIRSTATSSNENHRLNNIDMSGSSSSSSTRSCRISNRKARVNNDTNIRSTTTVLWMVVVGCVIFGCFTNYHSTKLFVYTFDDDIADIAIAITITNNNISSSSSSSNTDSLIKKKKKKNTISNSGNNSKDPTPIFLNSSSPQAQAGKCVFETIAKANSMSGSNNSVLQNTKDQHRRQILYLHPGPPKTATTTIQQLLTDHQKKLNSDNIFYLGKTMPREKWKCNFPHVSYCLMYKQYQPEDKGKCREIIEEQLNEYYRSGVDVILSDEDFGAMFRGGKRGRKGREFFSNILRSNNWEIRLLVGYRPYFNYVRSTYSEYYKASSKPRLYKWPGRGGMHIPPMNEELFQDRWPFSDGLIDLFKAHVDVIEVFDITQNNHRGDLSVRFFCDLLKEAQQTCSSMKASLNEVRKNVAMSHDYDRIATAAVTKGLVNATKFTRSMVTSWVKKFVEVTSNDSNSTTLHNLPLLCPTKDNIDRLHNVSLAKEMTLFPERQPNWETTGLFETMLKKKRLCSIDTDKVLEKEEWKEFFQLLEEK